MSSVVPEGWSKECLGSIFEKISNGTTANQVETEDGESVTRIETISNGYINFEKVGKINASDADKRYLMEQGDILFSNINSVKHIGKVAYFNGEKPLFHGMNLLLFRTNETYAHSKFIFNLMRSDDFRLEISKRVKPAINQASISGGDLKEINFLSPPLPEQKKIASILTSVDEVIENTQKQIDKLQDLKKATMNELLTKGIGHTEFKDSELGRIPKSWDVRTIGDIVNPKRPVTYGIVQAGEQVPDGIPYIRVSDMKSDSLHPAKMMRTSPVIAKKFTRSRVLEGDIVYALRGDVGKVLVVPRILEGANLTQGTALISKSDSIETSFLYWCFDSSATRKQTYDMAKGSTFVEMTLGNLKNIKIPVPACLEQSAIAKILDSIEGTISLKVEKFHQTQSLKKSLMQDLLTGKVRVTVN